MFETNPKSLGDLLAQVRNQALQLPDFQRDWVWTDEGVRQLLASVASGFPIGAILTLKTGGELRFKTRPLEHAPNTGEDPEQLLLDGQQRMTSLYQSLYSDQPVQAKNSKGRPVSVYYYLDIEKALSAARLEDAVFAVGSDRMIKSNFNRDIDLDLSTREKEFEAFAFPLNSSFSYINWQNEFIMSGRPEKLPRLTEFYTKIIERITKYQVPVITLLKENTREAVCTVFEKVNVGGKKLDAFELLTAMFAADEFDLREDLRGTDEKTFIAKHRRKPKPEEVIAGRIPRIRGPQKGGVFNDLDERDVLQVACALQTKSKRQAFIEEANREGRSYSSKEAPAVSIRAKDLLELDCEIYQSNADRMTRGYERARHFLNDLHIIRGRDIPYLPTAKTLAAVFAENDNRELNAAQKEKLERWFWCVTLGETYGNSTDTRVARDFLELIAWLDGKMMPGIDPRAIQEIQIRAGRLDELRTRISAGYKAVHIALLDQGCQDFRTGTEAYKLDKHEDPVDIHHIFPQAWAIKNGIEKSRYDTIVNKTPLFAQTNRIIGGQAPSKYLKKLEDELGGSEGGMTARERLDNILRSHLIDPDLLRADDFEGFYQDRKEKLLQLIEAKTGKDILRDAGSDDSDDVDEPLIEAAE
jgi:hypothetical protein